VRGGEGVLLTTSARSAQGASVTSTQMDASEALAGFKAAEELAQTLSDAATAQNALVSKNAATAHKNFVTLLDPEQKGKFSGAVNGQEASKAQSGSRELDASQPVEKFGAPVIVMDSPSSINWATPASTVLFAGQQLRWITQGDVQMTAAHTVSSVAANAASFFTHSGGIQAIAANGPVSLQAHTDQLEIVADKSVTVISVNDSIEIKANQKIVLQAGQSFITLEGGDITFACPGNFTVKGGKHVFDGGANEAASTPRLPDSRLKLFDEAFVLKDKDTGLPIPNYAYRIIRSDGSFERGITDEDGKTHIIASTEPENLRLEADTIEPDSFGQAVKEGIVCWKKDYVAEISAKAFGRYYVTSTLQGDRSKFSHDWVSRYKINVPLCSGPQIVVEVRIAAQHIPSGKDAASDEIDVDITPELRIRLDKAKEAFKHAAYSTWNGKFKIRITDPICGVRILPLRYMLTWTEAECAADDDPNEGYHYLAQFHEDEIHEGFRRERIELSYTTNAEALAHEFIHCFGVPDEYGKPKGSASVVNYYRPDGTLDDNMVVFSMGFKKHENDARWNIMSSNDSVRVERRHAWNIAIEVRDLLKKEIGRDIQCEIIGA